MMQANHSRPISAHYNKFASNNILTRTGSNELQSKVISSPVVSFCSGYNLFFNALFYISPKRFFTLIRFESQLKEIYHS